MLGQKFKSGFDMRFRQLKGTVFVYQSYGTAQQETSEYQAMINTENSNPSKVVFQFPERVPVQVGNVIQQKDSQDLWEVFETEDVIIGDDFIHFDVKVSRLGAAKPYPGGGAVVIHGHNYGAIQSHSAHSTQNVVLNTRIAPSISKLREILQASTIDELDKEEGQSALSRIEELASRPPNPKVAEKIKQKLDIVNGIFSVAKNLAGLAAPHLSAIAKVVGLG